DGVGGQPVLVDEAVEVAAGGDRRLRRRAALALGLGIGRGQDEHQAGGEGGGKRLLDRHGAGPRGIGPRILASASQAPARLHWAAGHESGRLLRTAAASGARRPACARPSSHEGRNVPRGGGGDRSAPLSRATVPAIGRRTNKKGSPPSCGERERNWDGVPPAASGGRRVLSAGNRSPLGQGILP